MMQPGFKNMDCMDGMKQFPDKFFDLAIVDPPYGGGAETIKEPENISGGVRHGTDREEDSAGGLTRTISANRTGGTWSRKYQRERQGRRIFETGISRRRRNISKSLHAFRKIKSFGEGTISTFRRRGAFLFGEKRTYRRKGSVWRRLNTHGRAFRGTRRYSMRSAAEKQTNRCGSIRHKSRLRSISGSSKSLQSRAIKSLIRT